MYRVDQAGPPMMMSICGCYYHLASPEYHIRIQKHYLPLVSSTVHSTILSTTSRTTLTQKFTNPSTTSAIKECTYTFPLYDGVSVVSFTCRIGKRVLRGLVKEKKKAKEIFDDAVSKGETAGLLEQTEEAADVFSTKLGNIPAGGSIIVEIEYIGELKHHETEGIRFTIPTRIAPRYGTAPFTLGTGSQAQAEGGIKITVDVSMPEGSFIKGVQSPSHPIAVSMGTISVASNADPEMRKASATLSLGSTALEKDFVLIVQSKDVGIPKAILETHPTIRNHRALMATLVPKFSLPPSRPEIVFVADRSGSMQGNMQMLISAMKVFLKSIPVGVKFNICSFGSSYSFLWPKSQSYSQETLQQATAHLVNFQANFGGTETFGAIQATVENRFKDIPLEIILLTDGDIWQQENLFKYVNEQVEQTNGNIRIFPLGIGNGVSHSLIEGLARAGNGFAQAVQDGERMDNSVVRMLRGALSPHITDYTLEVKYDKENDDFELIDKVTEGLKVLLAENEKKEDAKPTISLFNTNVNPEKEDLKGLQDSTFALPDIPFPKLHQAPHKIPTLFAFSRTSVYLLMSPETIQRNPTAVILRATSAHGPLELEIPIETLHTPAETIHQMAAKKAVQDLEEGRGWIYDAKDQNVVLVKERYASCFDELVKKEAVRLGEKFQIAGKWCSFVAVAVNDKEIADKEESMREQKSLVVDDDGDILYDMDSSEDEDSVDDSESFEMIGGSPSSLPGQLEDAASANVSPRKSGSRFRGPMRRLFKPSAPPLAQQSADPPKFAAVGLTPKTLAMSAASGSSNEKSRGFGTRGGRGSTQAMGRIVPDRSRDRNSMASASASPGGREQGGVPPHDTLIQKTDAIAGVAASAVMQQQSQMVSMSGRRQSQFDVSSSSSSPPPPPRQSAYQPQQPAYQSFGGGGPAGYSFQYSMCGPAPLAHEAAGTFGNVAPPPQYGSSAPPPQYAYPPARRSATQTFGTQAIGNRPPLMFDRFQPATSQAQAPPSIGQANSNLFGGIMAGTTSNTNTMDFARTESIPVYPIGQSVDSSMIRSPGAPVPAVVAAGLASPISAAQTAAESHILNSGRMTKKRAKKSRKSFDQDDDDIVSQSYVEPAIDWSSKSLQEKVARIIELQAFDGSWSGSDAEILMVLGLPAEDGKVVDRQVWVTLLVVKWLEIMASEEEGVWEMVVEKARGWLTGCGVMDVETLESEAAKEIEKLK
ncbi:von Willebrand factor type A domain containing protein [Hyaloscypha variabilis]